MEDLTSEPPTSINPYETLDLEKDATEAQIKHAYRRAALKHHPDKAPPSSKTTAHTKFQEIAFAYAILSSPQRRKQYDATGLTSDSLSLTDNDFNWTDFFRAQWADTINTSSLQKFRREYKSSEEENSDVIHAYINHSGDMDAIYEDVMLSDPLEDEARFRKMIDEAIEYGLVKAYRKYTGEPDKKTKRRMEKAKKEEYEAVELARELGVHEKLFGKEGSDDGGKKGTKKGKDGDGEEALAALIQQRQKGRSESFLDNLEAKYGGGAAASKKTKKRQKDEADDEEPSEEAFQAAASRLKGNKKDTKAQAAAETNEEGDSTRRSKRTKK